MRNADFPSRERLLHKCGSLDNCIRIIEEQCKNSQHILVKTIRMSLELADLALLYFPELKIIHLIRDPRGITNSRLHGGFSLTRKVESHSENVCSRFEEDLNFVQEIRSKSLSSITIVLYEALAEKPLSGAKFLYNFVGLPISNSTLVWVYNSTHAEDNGGFFGTARKDSAANAYKWRNELAFTTIQTIDKYCTTVYTMVGYLPMINNNSRNLQIVRQNVSNFYGFM